jgi:propionate CoA-transferase
MKPKIISATEAVALVQNGQTLSIGGGGAGHNVPDGLLKALGRRFVKTSHPRALKVLHPCGIGDNDKCGLTHLAHENLLHTVIGGFWGNAPKMGQLALQNKIHAYNLPQGVLGHLMRATAGGEKGLLKKTGLHTFVDPRLEGGRLNSITTKEIVEVTEMNGVEFLFYHTIPVDVAFIRGTSIDPEGNLTMEEEVASFAMLSHAQAAKVNGGMVIAQVKKVSEIHAKPISVKVPSVLIDYVVVEPDQKMTFITEFEAAFIDREASFEAESLSLEGIKRIIARRAAFELPKSGFVNLGYGIPDGIPIVAREEGLLSDITFMIEQGQTDGVIATGLNFGAMYNPTAIADDPYQFDFFHGGGLDICYLGFAQIDSVGNVNSSKFGRHLTGCGGFIDISQNTQKVVFAGAFAAKANINCRIDGIEIVHPGQFKKFVNKVEQVTFNGQYAVEQGQQVLYCTERAVFKLKKGGIELIEIAPGIDIEKDIFSMMEFNPTVSPELKLMDEVVFGNDRLRLRKRK